MKLFKASTSQNQIWNLVKTIFQIIVFWTVFLFLIPSAIIKIEEVIGITSFQGLPVLAVILFTVFSMIGLLSGYTMSWLGKGTPLPIDCPNELVISGPYKIVRNPMAVAGIGQGISVGLFTGSFFIIIYALSGAVLWHIFVRPIEEADLEMRFGESYHHYRNKTKCWIPRSL